ncbi:VOC family protein [Pseudovibrio sp. POLY-S9]|uniref:VOC family protein n=1 Tax=Pseudovibrio sp. POLY-S9 TaxID=1576596 RepID=UPI00070CCD61|nr:VOC family protein [Pseudovibrio sp. POLY-S9]
MHPDHVTVAVRNLEEARAFFNLLDFEEAKSLVISGPVFSKYMGISDLEAEHVTLVLKGHSPRFEIQLLHYSNPEPRSEPYPEDLCRTGYNHLCFAVDDLEDRLSKLQAAGFKARSEVMEFNDRKLVFLFGPEKITLELAQWTKPE